MKNTVKYYVERMNEHTSDKQLIKYQLMFD